MLLRHSVKSALAAATLALCACNGGGEETTNTPNPAAPAAFDVVAFLNAGSALEPAPAGISGNVTCTNWKIGAIALDSVSVPAGAACELTGTMLLGTLTVGNGASLTANGAKINGGLQAEGAAQVTLVGESTVGGSVQIEQGGTAVVKGAQISGDLQFDSMAGAVHAEGNQIGGSLQALSNRGGVLFQDNRINSNLQCTGNLPLPVVAGNSAALVENECVQHAPGTGGGGGGGGTVPAGQQFGNVNCVNLSVGAITVDSVIVPAGAACVLEGTRLNGSILVGAEARLTATNVSVRGNVIADNAASTVLASTDPTLLIEGSVQIKQGGSASLTGLKVVGSVQIDSMLEPVSVSTNAIVGSVQIMGNAGSVSVSANRIGAALQCKGNLVPPVGSGNEATIKEDQCLNL